MKHRAGLLVMALAGAALLAVWRTAPSVSPPLFDGCLAEPYRYLGANPAPTSARQTFAGGQAFEPAEIITDESPAQGQILMMAGTFVSSSAFTVSVTPVGAPQPAPAGEKFDGNAYRIVAITSPGGMLQPQTGVPVTIVLRATASNGPERTIIRLDGTTWTPPSKTASAGCGDEDEATSTRLGVFAIVIPAAQGGGSSGGVPAVLVIAVIAAVLVVAVVALVRMNRRPPRPFRR